MAFFVLVGLERGDCLGQLGQLLLGLMLGLVSKILPLVTICFTPHTLLIHLLYIFSHTIILFFLLFNLPTLLSLLFHIFSFLLHLPSHPLHSCLIQNTLLNQILYSLPNRRELGQVFLLLFNKLLLQVVFQVAIDDGLGLLVQKVHVVLHSIHQLVLCVVGVQVETLLVAAFVLFQEVCAVFCCPKNCCDLPALDLYTIQRLYLGKKYLNCKGRIHRLLISYVDLNQCCSVFALRTDYYLVDCTVFSKMMIVAQQLKSADKYVWVVVFGRKTAY